MNATQTRPYSCEFPYLFREICVGDCYHLRQVSFVPDVVLDIGANVGTFTSYARFLFPSATIVAVEPDPRNWELLLKHTSHLPDVWHLKAALGTGELWHASVADMREPYFGGGEQYITRGQIGFPESKLNGDDDFRPAYAGLKAISLDRLVGESTFPDAKVLLKIDAEGAENCIFDHALSMAALRRCDYVTMEVHLPIPPVCDALMSLAGTHECNLDAEHYYFQATRKWINGK